LPLRHERKEQSMTNRARICRRVAIVALSGAVLGAVGCRSERPAAQEVAVQPAQAPQARRVIRPEKSPDIGLPYSPGILAGNTLYIAGHLGRDPGTGQLVAGGIEAEARQSLANIREVLRAAGMDFGDVTSVTVYITDFKEFDRFNSLYREYFPSNQPARATVQVAALNGGARIELQMIAVKP
jgi:2-iminobutanoate/2-iminopropanoate deaminase